MSAIFISYQRGAGGEFLSVALSGHKNFYKPNYSVITEGRILTNDITNYLHSNGVSEQIAGPQESFNTLSQYINQDLTYVFPCHVTEVNINTLNLIKQKTNSKVISIYSREYKKLINLEFVRKRLLAAEPVDIGFVVQRNPILDGTVMEKIRKQKFLSIDLLLLADHQELNNENRVAYIEKFLDRKHQTTYANSDYFIKWEDLFYNLDKIPETYTKLVNYLNIDFDENVLQNIIKRNTDNKTNLLNFDYKQKIKDFYDNISS